MKSIFFTISLCIVFNATISIAQSTITPNAPAALKNGVTIGNTQITEPGTMRFTGSSYEVFKDNKWRKLALVEATSSFEPPETIWAVATFEESCKNTCPNGYVAHTDNAGNVCADNRGVLGQYVTKKTVSFGGGSSILGWNCVTASGTYELSRCHCKRIQ